LRREKVDEEWVISYRVIGRVSFTYRYGRIGRNTG
jgi:hypothetical protein